MKENSYEYKVDSGGYTVRASKRGWIVEGWTRWQGSHTGWRWLLPYGQPGVPGPDAVLTRVLNDGSCVGDHIRYMCDYQPHRVLRRGYEVF